MITPIEREAEMLVVELSRLFDARFELHLRSSSAPHWSVEPGPGLQAPMRAFLKGFDIDHDAFDHAMIRAIKIANQSGTA